ncbi:hypothetical protein HOY80DRAFT_950926 [Tuber brumale]|nr:hypothetical protein HOY80DRAFT_950926 [Tuber brumale]
MTFLQGLSVLYSLWTLDGLCGMKCCGIGLAREILFVWFGRVWEAGVGGMRGRCHISGFRTYLIIYGTGRWFRLFL